MAQTAETFISEAAPPRRPEPERDRYGRYLLPNPETGEVQAWTRATTFAETVADQHGLTLWKCRKTGLGVALRPDLQAAFASVPDPESKDGKKKLNKYVEQAMEFAGSTTRATIGTALHAWLEEIDGGREVTVPEQWKRDVAAYYVALEKAGITLSRNYIERICLVPELGVAGTMDRLGRFVAGDPFVFDIKSGTDLAFSLGGISIQLALYAHSTHCWDPQDGQLHPMPKVQQDTAVVMHLPAGEGKATPLYIDIKSGWEQVQHCSAVRAWRARRNFAYPVLPGAGVVKAP